MMVFVGIQTKAGPLVHVQLAHVVAVIGPGQSYEHGAVMVTTGVVYTFATADAHDVFLDLIRRTADL